MPWSWSVQNTALVLLDLQPVEFSVLKNVTFRSLFGSLFQEIIYSKVSYYLAIQGLHHDLSNKRTRIYVINEKKKSGDWFEG